MFKVFQLTGTSPASASTAAGTVLGGLDNWDRFFIDAALVGATGGTLDVYLQRNIENDGSTDIWVDWLHFPQLASNAAAVKYSVPCSSANGSTIVAVGRATTPALAANTFLGGHPGKAVRALYVAGASTTVGAAVDIRISAWRFG